jgi:hypothetical protein
MYFSSLALHERLGYIWYGLNDGSRPIAKATAIDATPDPAPRKK